MRKKILLPIIIFTLSFYNIGYAQENKQVIRANEKYDNYSFSPAIDIYKKVLDKGYVSADLLKKLGNSYYFNANYEDAAKIYKRLVEEYPSDVTPGYYFRYAQTLKTIGDYDNSNNTMSKFIAATSDDVRASIYKDEKNYLRDIERNSGRYTITPFEYNSPYSEFAPSYYKEGVIFSSDRDTGNLAKYRHTWNSQDFLDLYKVDESDFSIGVVKKLGAELNTRLHESTSTVTKDGNTIYFTRNNFKSGKYVKDENGVIRLKIFKATLVDDVWTNIEELPFNSDSYSIAHPALSSDEKTMYFASDMPGTHGESDIFKIAINEDGSFGTPINLGNKINTEARETFPFVSSKEVLYFSSDGHPGLGGLDIFATKIIKEGQAQGIIANIGAPANSKTDDFTFIFDEDSKTGYLASNRAEGQGADDIYSFVEDIPLLLECEQKITGTVRDKISNEILAGATVKVINKDNEEVTTVTTDAEGNYELLVDCNEVNFIRALIKGYVPSEEYLERSDEKPRIIDFYLERDTVTGGYGDDLAKLLQLSTIYFDFDKFNIRPDAEIEIQKIIAAMEKYPELKVKANSHTDSKGKDSYNLWLSKQRANSTIQYMISKGISSDRLQSEGFGENKLVNKCTNDVKCTKEEHQLNRRSEFIIIK